MNTTVGTGSDFSSFNSTFLSPFIDLMCVALILFGMFIAQVHTYWTSYNDAWGIRTMVFLLCVVEVTHTVFAILVLHTYYKFSDSDEALPIIWSVKAITFSKVFTVAIAESFTLYRVWKLSRSAQWLAIIPSFLIFAGISLGVAASCRLALGAPTWVLLASDAVTRKIVNTMFAVTATADVCIAGMLIYFLQKHRSAFRRTQFFIQKLVFYAANTGTLTAVFSVATLITFNMEFKTAAYIGMIEVLSKMYANAMITMLNARRPHRETRAVVDETNVIPMANRPVSPRVKFMSMQPKEQGVHVHIHTETIAEASPPADDNACETSSQKDEYATII